MGEHKELEHSHSLTELLKKKGGLIRRLRFQMVEHKSDKYPQKDTRTDEHFAYDFESKRGRQKKHNML